LVDVELMGATALESFHNVLIVYEVRHYDIHVEKPISFKKSSTET